VLAGFGQANMKISALMAVLGAANAQLPRSPGHGGRANPRCEPVSIPMCSGVAYNDTIFPNLLGNANQEQAGQDMSEYTPLIKIGCSPDIQLFLCSLYAPVCTILDAAIPPCRALCLSARAGCEHLMIQFGFTWPDEFNCERFPEEDQSDVVCVVDGSRSRISDGDLQRVRTSTLGPPGLPPGFGSPGLVPFNGREDSSASFKCPVQLRQPPELEYHLRVGPDQVVEDCGMPCYPNVTFYDAEEAAYARNWSAAWSTVCLCLCFFTAATFAVGSCGRRTPTAGLGRALPPPTASVFPYPERPIAYLAASYAGLAAVLLFGYVHGDAVACNPAVDNRTLNFRTEMTVRQGAIGQDTRCTLTAMAAYFFLMAGSLWWVMLSVSWFLSAGLKWSQEAIDAKAHFFHAVAWSAPGLQTLAVVVLQLVEGDVLTGVCFVGIWDVDALRYFVLAPLAVYLATGVVFTALGFFALVKIRTIMKQDGTKTDKLERLMIRIGVFTALYVLPSAALIACYVYEQSRRPEWTQQWQEAVCRDPVFRSKWQTPCRFPEDPFGGPTSAPPAFHLRLAESFCALLAGSVSSFWIFRARTAAAWRAFFARLRGRGAAEYV